MKILTHGRWLWTRTIGSTLVGELVDSLIFIASSFFVQSISMELIYHLGDDQLPVQVLH